MSVDISTPSGSHRPVGAISTPSTQQRNGTSAILNQRGIFQDGYWLCDCPTRQRALKYKVTRNTPNIGRLFYRCPLWTSKDLVNCDFFLWKDDATIRENQHWDLHPEIERFAALNESPTPTPTPTINRTAMLPTPQTGNSRITDYNGFTSTQGPDTEPRSGKKSGGAITPPDSPTARLGKKRARPDGSRIKLDSRKKNEHRRGRVRSRATTYDSEYGSSAEEAEADNQKHSIQTARKRRRVDGQETIRSKGKGKQVDSGKNILTVHDTASEAETSNLDTESDDGGDTEVDERSYPNRNLYAAFSYAMSVPPTPGPNPFQASSRQSRSINIPGPSISNLDDSIFLVPAKPSRTLPSTAPVQNASTPTHRPPLVPPSSAPSRLQSRSFNTDSSAAPLPPPGSHEQSVFRILQQHKVHMTPALRKDLSTVLRRQERRESAQITGKNWARGKLKEHVKEVIDLREIVEIGGMAGSFKRSINLGSEDEEEEFGSDLDDGTSSVATSVIGAISRESTVDTRADGGYAWSDYGRRG